MQVIQGVPQSATQLLFAGLYGKLVDQCMPRHPEPPRSRLDTIEHAQPLRCRQHVKRQAAQLFQADIERAEAFDDVVACARCHAPNVMERSIKKCRFVTTERKVA